MEQNIPPFTGKTMGEFRNYYEKYLAPLHVDGPLEIDETYEPEAHETKRMVMKVCEGVEIAFDQDKFEAVGMPLGITIDDSQMRLSFDLKVHVVAGNQDSTVENILTLTSV